MKLFDLLKSSKVLSGIFIISLLVLIFFANLSYRQISTINESEKLVIHSYRVNIELELLHSYLKDAEIGQRGYVITLDSVFLQPYLGARQKVNKSFINLISLTSDNVVQQRNLDTLFILINKRFAWMVTALKLSNSENSISEKLKEELYEGKKVMDDIRRQIDKMKNFEVSILQLREQQHQDNISITPLTSLFLFLFSLIIFVFSFFKINRDRVELKNLNKQLLKRNKELELQILDEFSSDFTMYEQGNNLIDTIALELSQKTKLEYILIGELNYDIQNEPFIKTISFISNGKIEENIEFNLKGGPWENIEKATLNSFPKGCKSFFSDNPIIQVYNIDAYIGFPLYGEDSTPLGIIAVMQQKEITEISYTKSLLKIAARRTELELEKMNYQKMLETKNVELERQNSELASFNYVASHDLQEPLRKIITFSNLLNQKYADDLSLGSKEYIDKIVSSAKRMSDLIEDLLNFSWISNSKDEFVETDLNEIVKEVLIDLEEYIKEKSAKINIGILPVLKANPLQMTQLFLNIISNAIKFSKNDLPPEIIISAKDLSLAEIKKIPKLNLNLDYCKISIKDNGIGFEQKYIDKIFTIFQRLHGKNEYSGTGIGLALSKKIVENHSGYITAQSELNYGAIFIIILPKI